MTWLFAILIVLAMGGVAVAAAGRIGTMPEAYDDRPDARVPAGELAGDDLRRVRFSLGVRGYRMSEVDTLLSRLAEQLDAARAETDDVQDESREDTVADSDERGGAASD
ncbi:DivIVA domain-containing protein [Nocardioides sp. InS609-2]|uniref:DivIVA domain-containing protein n=1 Tax=Nocardioides sp. InS609-2 TaxID=2760705 RepID=UPI0020BDB180|nr:DivIVA domain-containing protein [Nocardioides sp. InS609-2]